MGLSICSALYEHEIQRSTNNADSEDEEAPEDGEAVPGGVDPQRQASPTTAQLISKGRNGEGDMVIEIRAQNKPDKGTMKGGGIKMKNPDKKDTKMSKMFNDNTNNFMIQVRSERSIESKVTEKSMIWSIREAEARATAYLTDHHWIMSLVNTENVAIAGCWANSKGRRIVFRDGISQRPGKLTGLTKHVNMVSHKMSIMQTICLTSLRTVNTLCTLRMASNSPFTITSPSLLAELETVQKSTPYYPPRPRKTLEEIFNPATDDIPTPLVMITAANATRPLKAMVTYDDQFITEIFIMDVDDNIENVASQLNETDAARLRWSNGYKKRSKKEDENETKFHTFDTLRIWDIKGWAEDTDVRSVHYKYPGRSASNNYVNVMDEQFTAKYNIITTGRKTRVFDPPWTKKKRAFFEWTPETLNHDMVRFMVRFPELKTVKLQPTAEQKYEILIKEHGHGRRLSGRERWQDLEDSLVYDSDIPETSSDADDEVYGDLNERLVFGAEGTSSKDQHGLTYNVLKGKKDTREERLYAAYRCRELSNTDSNESNEEGQNTKDIEEVDLTESDDEVIDIKDENQDERDEFNKLCGDYQVRYNHTRTLRRTASDSEEEKEEGKVQKRPREEDDTPEIPMAKKKRVERTATKSEDDGLRAFLKTMGRESLERLAEYSSPGPSTSSDSIKKTRRELAELSKETLASLATTLSDIEEDNEIDEESIKKEYEKEDLEELDRKEAKLEKKADKTRLRLKKKMEEKLKKVKSSERADELTTIKTKLRILKDVKIARKETIKRDTKAFLLRIKKSGTMDKWHQSLAKKKERDQLRDNANGIEEKKGKFLLHLSKTSVILVWLTDNNSTINRRRNFPSSKAGRQPQKRIQRRGLLRRRQYLPPHRWRRPPGKHSLNKTRTRGDILFYSESDTFDHYIKAFM